jgi:hypothetical protein
MPSASRKLMASLASGLLGLALHASVCPAAEYWVSTKGDDAWPGSRPYLKPAAQAVVC